MLSKEDGLIYGLGALACAVVGAIVTLIRNRKKLTAWFAKTLSGHEFPGKKDIDQHRAVYNALVELRALCDSDRAYVIRFHNGHEFLLSDPVWKCTCTHEVVRPGVTYESVNIQDLLVSRVAELVEPIIAGEYGQGASKPSECENCQYKPECNRTRKNLVVFQVEEMQAGFTKFFLQNQNIKTLIMCGLTSKHGPFGVVGIDITGAPVGDPHLLNELSARVCETSEKIQFLFLKREMRDTGRTPKSD